MNQVWNKASELISLNSGAKYWSSLLSFTGNQHQINGVIKSKCRRMQLTYV